MASPSRKRKSASAINYLIYLPGAVLVFMVYGFAIIWRGHVLGRPVEPYATNLRNTLAVAMPYFALIFWLGVLFMVATHLLNQHPI